MQKKIGFVEGVANADALNIHNGMTASTQFRFEGDNDLLFYLPMADGSNGEAIKTDGNGNLSFGPVASTGGATGPTGPQGPQGATGSLAGVTLFSMQSGTFSASSMTGTPLIYDVTFVGSISGSYIVSVESDSPRDWTITNKTSSGFRVESNSTSAITDIVYWTAQQLVTGQIGVVVGATGSNGTSGTSGNSGTSGTSFYGTTSGTSGTNGSTGANGSSGTAGTSGIMPSITFTAYITDTTTQAKLITGGNWTSGVYSGPSISGTYQGQKYYSSTQSYVYEAVADNVWVRTPIS